jgi:hypothetical protein
LRLQIGDALLQLLDTRVALLTAGTTHRSHADIIATAAAGSCASFSGERLFRFFIKVSCRSVRLNDFKGEHLIAALPAFREDLVQEALPNAGESGFWNDPHGRQSHRPATVCQQCNTDGEDKLARCRLCRAISAFAGASSTVTTLPETPRTASASQSVE